MFYIEIENKIVLFDTDRDRLENTLEFMPQYSDAQIQETEKEIVYINDEFRFKEDVLKEIRLQEIEQELAQVDRLYEITMNTPILYTNGHYYKPRYVQESYVLLLAADIFPITIWDSTELNSVEMAKNDLLILSMFLKGIAEPAFQERKTNRLSLLLEKEELLV